MDIIINYTLTYRRDITTYVRYRTYILMHINHVLPSKGQSKMWDKQTNYRFISRHK